MGGDIADTAIVFSNTISGPYAGSSEGLSWAAKPGHTVSQQAAGAAAPAACPLSI